MKPGLPWSVKGIEPDVREVAKQAARRSGMTLGEWLNSTILDLAEVDVPAAKPKLKTPRQQSAPKALDHTANRLEDIAEQLSRLASRESGVSSRFGIHAAGHEPADPQVLHNVLSRVENNERKTVEAFVAVNERLATMNRQMAQFVATRPEAKPEDSPGLVALEKAVRNIVEHLETSEKRNRDTLKAMHDRIAAMSAKAATADNEQVLRQAPAFAQLENRLGDLARRVERSEATAQGSGLPDMLRHELTELASRIDTVRDTAEALASRAQTQAVQASQQELRAIEQRIHGLLKEAQASLNGAGPGPAEMQRLHGEIERLNHRIDEAHRNQASGGDVLALRAAVEQLSTRVAQGPDLRPLAEMDRRILDVTQRLEQTQAATRSIPQFTELEHRVAELDHRLNEAVMGRASAHSAALEDKIAEVSERVGRTEQQLSSLETIERAVNQLFESFAEQRKWTEEVAEGAASRMAERFLNQAPTQISPASSPEFQALEEGLQAVRMAAETSDQRNQETLEAVHETLEQIVTKLAELEATAIGQRVAVAAAPAANDAGARNAYPSLPAEGGLGASPFEAQHPDAAIFDSTTVEAANVAAPVNPFESPFQAMQPPAIGTSPGAPVMTDDFIAAARRAAQASAQQKSILHGIAPGAARISERSSSKFLNFSVFRKRKPESPAPAPGLVGEIKHPPGFKPANSNSDRRRKLVLMGFVLLAAVAAFSFNLMGRASRINAPVAPSAIEQSLEVPAPKTSATPAPQAATKPKPAVVESGIILPDVEVDPLLTGSLPQTDQDDAISAYVSGEVAPAENLPPAESGPLKLREAAALGNSNAQFLIATRYLNGEKVKQDPAKAAYWYGKAAAQGLAPAQYRLATLYERGLGVAKDLKAALGWYERAAALGNVKAMHNAAVLSAGSDIKAPDYARAFKWFSLGAAHGLKDSQFNLAVLLERGMGTAANARDAMFWYSVAAQQDDADAAKRAEALGKSLSKEDIEAVKSRLAKWKPEHAPDVANTIAVTNPDWRDTGDTQG